MLTDYCSINVLILKLLSEQVEQTVRCKASISFSFENEKKGIYFYLCIPCILMVNIGLINMIWQFLILIFDEIYQQPWIKI